MVGQEGAHEEVEHAVRSAGGNSILDKALVSVSENRLILYLVMTCIVFVLTIQIERRQCCQGNPLLGPVKICPKNHILDCFGDSS